MQVQSQGNVMCILREKKDVPKGEKQQLYGILLHNLKPDSTCGICIMEDGHFLTLSRNLLLLSFKWVKEDNNYKISQGKATICQALYYQEATSHKKTLDIKLRECEKEFNLQLIAPKAPRPKALDISIGSFVTMYFTWAELEDKTGNLAVIIPGEPGDELGEHRTGKVIGKRKQKNRWVHDCQFDGTIPTILGFFVPDLRRGRTTYEKWAQKS
jgi:hypothetical protein